MADNRDTKNNDIDFFPTPPVATRALFEREPFTGTIWDCACGDGAICKVATQEFGYFSRGSDIVNHGYGDTGIEYDFLGLPIISPAHPYDIVTNPPYKYAQEFIERALAISHGKVAMILRLNFLEIQKRYNLFQTTPLKAVYVFSYRVPFQHPAFDKPRTDTAYAWFVWDHHYKGEPVIRWIPKSEEL